MLCYGDGGSSASAFCVWAGSRLVPAGAYSRSKGWASSSDIDIEIDREVAEKSHKQISMPRVKGHEDSPEYLRRLAGMTMEFVSTMNKDQQ
jgi:hypothetical protein